VTEVMALYSKYFLHEAGQAIAMQSLAITPIAMAIEIPEHQTRFEIVDSGENRRIFGAIFSCTMVAQRLPKRGVLHQSRVSGPTVKPRFRTQTAKREILLSRFLWKRRRSSQVPLFEDFNLIG
jgi:hypothetical protein